MRIGLYFLASWQWQRKLSFGHNCNVESIGMVYHVSIGVLYCYSVRFWNFQEIGSVTCNVDRNVYLGQTSLGHECCGPQSLAHIFFKHEKHLITEPSFSGDIFLWHSSTLAWPKKITNYFHLFQTPTFSLKLEQRLNDFDSRDSNRELTLAVQWRQRENRHGREAD